MIFKKGHIVPRWCGVKTQDRKAQHCMTFGCDVRVEICKGHIIMQMLSEGACLIGRGIDGSTRPMKNGTFKKTPTTIKGVHVIGYKES